MNKTDPMDARLSAGQIEEAERDGRSLARLLKILKILRSPDGCPWDREQTHESLRPYLLEECHEVLEAIDGGSMEELCEELGDLSLHVAFQAELAEESGAFRLSDSLDHIAEKLVRRHPHVFGGSPVMDVRDGAVSHGGGQPGDARDVERLWERIKVGERRDKLARDKGEDKHGASILDGLPKSLPGLLKAQRIQEKVAGVGFEWENAEGAVAKLEEEYGEFREALAARDGRAMEVEFGDFLFSVVNVARYLGVQPEDALRRSNDKFVQRFRLIEGRLHKSGGDIAHAGLDVLDGLWEEIKAEERAAVAAGGGVSARDSGHDGGSGIA